MPPSRLPTQPEPEGTAPMAPPDPHADPAPRHFPYAFTPPPRVPWYARFRAEGRPPSACIWHGLHYLLKYRRKLRIAPPEAIPHFAHQRQLIRFLAHHPAPRPEATLAMVGDLMWIRDGWASFLHPEVLALLAACDATVGNLETVVARNRRVPSLTLDCTRFNSHPGLVTSFRRPDGSNIFAALSMANNHVLDLGDGGLDETAAFLDEQGIARSGVARDDTQPRHVLFHAGPIRIGFHAATWGVNDPRTLRRSDWSVNTVPGLAPDEAPHVDLSGIHHALAAMDADGADLKAIALHWGHEYELYPTPKQMRVARDIVRAGADVIVGSHPHVAQPAEVCFVNGYEARYGPEARQRLAALSPPAGCILTGAPGPPRKALILYSLGNFTTAMYTLLCQTGLIQTIALARDEATGRADWHAPAAQLVYNARRHPATGTRRLVLLESWLRDFSHRLRPQARADLALLRGHIVAGG